MMNDLDALEEIADAYLEEDELPESELNFVFRVLEKGAPKDRVRAAILLTSRGHDTICKVVERFPRYDKKTQKFLAPLLAAAPFVEVFVMFFEVLKKCKDSDHAALILLCIARAEYATLTIWFQYYPHATGRFQHWMKLIIKYMGIRKLAPELSMYPVIPFEEVFREVFDDETIDAIYAD